MIEGEFTARTIAVIGSGGKMGSMFCRRFSDAGYKVMGYDQPLLTNVLQAGLPQADIVMLSVPAAAFGPVLEQISEYLTEKQILVDVASVKVDPMRQMRSFHNGPVVGTHPLFGPEPKEEEVRVAVTPDEATEQQYTDAVCKLFARIGCDPFITTAEQHDEAAALIQGLNFVTSVAYLATLAHKEEITPFLTPSFQRRLDAARKMITEDAELFEGLFESNPYSQDAVRSFRSMLNLAAGGDVSLLVDRAVWWWRDNDISGGVQ